MLRTLLQQRKTKAKYRKAWFLAFVFMSASAAAVDTVEDSYDPIKCLVRCLDAGGGKKTCEYICSPE